jgi:hypothetical protein
MVIRYKRSGSLPGSLDGIVTSWLDNWSITDTTLQLNAKNYKENRFEAI